MRGIKPQVDGKKLFIAIGHLLGGVICILAPALRLPEKSFYTIVLGIILVHMGSGYFRDATVGFREKQRKEQQIKKVNETSADTNGIISEDGLGQKK